MEWLLTTIRLQGSFPSNGLHAPIQVAVHSCSAGAVMLASTDAGVIVMNASYRSYAGADSR